MNSWVTVMNNFAATTPLTSQEKVFSRQLVDRICNLLGESVSEGVVDERTRERFPIFFRMDLTPIDRDGGRTCKTFAVFGKDISTAGICFSHDMELRCKRFVLKIPFLENQPLAVEAEVTWTRQAPIGLFETGCRLVRKL